jgi:hypothetical protein
MRTPDASFLLGFLTVIVGHAPAFRLSPRLVHHALRLRVVVGILDYHAVQ